MEILKKQINEFDNYLNFHKYKFKDDTNEAGGYVSIKK